MKKIIRFSIALFVIVSVTIVFRWNAHVYLEEEQTVLSKAPQKINNKKINIGIIGESWAAGRKIDSYLKNYMETNGFETTVISQGHSGAISREVYKDLFKEKGLYNSSTHILYESPINICIILIGVNDTAGHVGAEFYAYHLNLIVKALISRGITPLVVEVPEYGIEEVGRKSILGKIKTGLMKAVNDNFQTDVISKYRAEAKQRLLPYISKGEIIYFPFKSISSNFSLDRHLYNKDALHLNSEGNMKLAFELSKVISHWLNQKTLVK
jgi:lysophospholipase L1-like esterase